MAGRTYPFGPAERLELHPEYARLRATEPVSRVALPFGGEGWLLTRYADIKTALRDPRLSRALAAGNDIPRTRPQPSKVTSILAMDPPAHTRIRRIVARQFTTRRVESWRARTRQIATEHLDTITAHGAPGDLRAQFAVPVPITVLLEFMGIAGHDQPSLVEAADTIMSTSATSARITLARRQLAGQLAELIQRRRSHPADDLLGRLVAARDGSEQLTDAELLDLAVALIVVGWETTAAQLANFSYALLTQPGQWNFLRANPARIASVVEELLRFVPMPVAAEFARVATTDVEIAGTVVRRGEAVLFALASANRDPVVCPDPDTLDVSRPPSAHLTFGHGAHRCPGAALARMEIQEALAALVERLPGLRLAGAPDEVPWRSGYLLRSPSHLPVAW